MTLFNGYPDDYKSALEAAKVRELLPPMAATCPECGSQIEKEPHDAACIIGWIDEMPADYTDDSSDLAWRHYCNECGTMDHDEWCSRFGKVE